MLKILNKLENLDVDKLITDFKGDSAKLRKEIQDMKLLLEGINTNLRLILAELRRK
jgi:hypothetical protein